MKLTIDRGPDFAASPLSPNVFVLLMALMVAIFSVAAQAEPRGYFQIVYDTSKPTDPKYQTDFGYAVFIHYDGKRILMDTGTNPSIMENNLRVAGIDPATLDMVVMTHNHHDHAGGLKRIRELNPRVPVLIPPGQDFGISSVNVVDEHVHVTPNIFIIRGHTDVPTAGIYDDLSVVLRSASGPYVLSSCSHSGVDHILDRASQVAGEGIYYFSGGSRLIHRPEGDAEKVAKVLAERNVQVVSPSHCNLSHRVDGVFRKQLGARVAGSQLGRKIEVSVSQSKPEK